MIPVNSNNESSITQNENSTVKILPTDNQQSRNDDNGQSPIGLPPPSLLGRTLSASAADCRTIWRIKKKPISADKITNPQPSIFSHSADSSTLLTSSRIAGPKRKYSSQQEFSNSLADIPLLPNFVNSLPNSTLNSPQMLKPMPNNMAADAMVSSREFVTPIQPKKLSRPNSPSSTISRPILPRGRVASIRRESDCSSENEAAHEKMVKTTQQVSEGFDDFCLDEKLIEERKRAKSLTEPISIFTNAFLPHSSSPSPTRANVDTQKQCYSPLLKEVVRNNIPYSPNPSPTPGSPFNRMRSMSPIAVRHISKRRYTASGGPNAGRNNGNGSGLESDGESSVSSSCLSAPTAKRKCTTPRNVANASPLIRDSTANFHQMQQQQNFHQFTAINLAEPALTSSSSAASPVYSNSSNSLGISPATSSIPPPRLLVDPRITTQCFPSTSSLEGQEEEDSMVPEEDGPLTLSSYCSISYDANSSTTFSSRANTPHSEMLDNSGTENDISFLLLPPQSSCSSDGSSQSSVKFPMPIPNSQSQQPSTMEQQQPREDICMKNTRMGEREDEKTNHID